MLDKYIALYDVYGYFNKSIILFKIMRFDLILRAYQ